MRKLLLATAATVAIATPAAARDGSGYIGLEGGILFPHSQNGVFTATFTQTAQSPAAGTAAPAPGTGLVGALPAALATPPSMVTGASRVKWKEGYDIDVVGGYDFGMFRVEGELGYKRSKIKRFTQDPAFGTAIATGLNPAGTTGTTFVFPTVSTTTFNLNDHTSVLSGMLNGLLDFGGADSINFSVGGGAGYARLKEFGGSHSGFAWQLLAEARYPVSANIDIGLKYRYFRTGRHTFVPTGTTFAGSTRTVAVPNVPPPGGVASGSTDVTFTRTAAVTGAFDDHFSSHSLLLSLIYNFAEAAPPPPPPPPAQRGERGH